MIHQKHTPISNRERPWAVLPWTDLRDHTTTPPQRLSKAERLLTPRDNQNPSPVNTLFSVVRTPGGVRVYDTIVNQTTLQKVSPIGRSHWWKVAHLSVFDLAAFGSAFASFFSPSRLPALPHPFTRTCRCSIRISAEYPRLSESTYLQSILP